MTLSKLLNLLASLKFLFHKEVIILIKAKFYLKDYIKEISEGPQIVGSGQCLGKGSCDYNVRLPWRGTRCLKP